MDFSAVWLLAGSLFRVSFVSIDSLLFVSLIIFLLVSLIVKLLFSLFEALIVVLFSKLLFVLYLLPNDDGKLESFLDENEISYINLNPIFEKYSKVEPLIWKLNGHWNIAGNHLVGAVVSKFIIENDLVEVSEKAKNIEKINAQIIDEFGHVF